MRLWIKVANKSANVPVRFVCTHATTYRDPIRFYRIATLGELQLYDYGKLLKDTPREFWNQNWYNICCYNVVLYILSPKYSMCSYFIIVLLTNIIILQFSVYYFSYYIVILNNIDT